MLEQTRPLSLKIKCCLLYWQTNVASLHFSCKVNEKINLAEELHIAMQYDDVRLMRSEINEFQLIYAEKGQTVSKLHPYWYPISSGDQNSAEGPTAPKMLMKCGEAKLV